MNISKLAIALATFATITLSSAAYIATKEVTSAVLVDKAKHSLDLTTNGLYHISLSEAFTIDKSEATQINFLRCSFSQPEFRFSWFCHQLKTDGKMTKQSYLALKVDQEKAYQQNVVKRLMQVSYEMMKAAIQLREVNSQVNHDAAHSQQKEYATYEMMKAAMKLHRINSPVGQDAAHSQQKVYQSDLNNIMKKSEVNESKPTGVLNDVEQGGRELSKAGTETVIRKNLSDAQAFAASPLTEIDRVSIQELIERLGDTEITSEIKDLDPILFRAIAEEQRKDYVVDFTSLSQYLGLVPADTDSTYHAGIGQKKHKVNDRIFVCCMLIVLFTMLIILFVSLYKDAEDFCKGIREIFGKKTKGGKENE